jgi:ComF family protein
LLEFFLPGRCANCGASGSGEALCPPCRAALPWLAPIPHPEPPESGLGETFAPMAMQGEARNWIHRFKYPARGLTGLDPGALGVARLLARAAGRRAPILATDRIVPIPLHPRRLRRRGFNPAALVAREIARLHGSPLEAHWLVRTLDTPPQAGLDARSRQLNVAGAFACLRRNQPAPQRVWLVDDVTTTGATLASAGQALRRAGVRVVMGVCLAQTPRPRGG